MAAIGITPSGTKVAEDVRDLQRLPSHDGGALRRWAFLRKIQPFERAHHRAQRVDGDMRIARGRVELRMAEQHLDQRQRVALARALLKDAAILVLDEATAGVDSETEEHIQLALDRIAGRRTILLVAHRLSTVRSADRVVVIEDGQIVEQGRPSDLLSRSSRCRDLFAAQVTMQDAAE